MSKEKKVFLCPINSYYFDWIKNIKIPPDKYMGDLIKEWSSKKTLPLLAKRFIAFCDQFGFVYTLSEYQEAINSINNLKPKEIITLTESYIFITDKY